MPALAYPLRPSGGRRGSRGERLEAEDHAELEREKSNQLRQGDDAVGAPACVEQALQSAWVGVARPESEQMGMLHRGRDAGDH